MSKDLRENDQEKERRLRQLSVAVSFLSVPTYGIDADQTLWKIVSDKRFNLFPQLLITSASFIEKGCPCSGLMLERGTKIPSISFQRCRVVMVVQLISLPHCGNPTLRISSAKRGSDRRLSKTGSTLMRIRYGWRCS